MWYSIGITPFHRWCFPIWDQEFVVVEQLLLLIGFVGDYGDAISDAQGID